MLTLVRTRDIARTNRGNARRLVVVTNFGLVLDAIENADDEDAMPPGVYTLIMATMAKRKVRGLWLPGTELFMHAANYAEQLEGCWSPGQRTGAGVGESRHAVQTVFDSEGGYEERKPVPFRCVLLDQHLEAALAHAIGE